MGEPLIAGSVPSAAGALGRLQDAQAKQSFSVFSSWRPRAGKFPALPLNASWPAGGGCLRATGAMAGFARGR